MRQAKDAPDNVNDGNENFTYIKSQMMTILDGLIEVENANKHTEFVQRAIASTGSMDELKRLAEVIMVDPNTLAQMVTILAMICAIDPQFAIRFNVCWNLQQTVVRQFGGFDSGSNRRG